MRAAGLVVVESMRAQRAPVLSMWIMSRKLLYRGTVAHTEYTAQFLCKV